MKRLIALVLLFSLPALAGPTLENRDGKRYEYDLDCGQWSKQRKVSAHGTAQLEAACTVKVKGAGQARVHHGSRCVIHRSTLDCG